MTMVKNLKKFLICISILLILFNSVVGNLALAADYTDDVKSGFQEGSQDGNGGEGIGTKLAKIMSGLVGLITWIPRAMAVGGITAVQAIAASVAKMAGETNPDPDNPLITLTPDDILFNKITLTDINFFTTAGLPDNNPVKTIRLQVSLWYNVMRTIAIMISVIVLLIVGIRMTITTIASEKAIYKKALIDWTTSFVLIFFLHYLINVIIWCNNALVDILYSTSASGTIKDVLDSFKKLLFDVDFIVGAGSLVVYIMITIQTLMFLISYIKRMLTLAFLIIIAPLITITYSIDKMGDQKAQALNSWLKEFVYNVLIQPFHCILYLAFATTAIQTISSGGNANLAAVILAIICIHFVWTGEKIVNKIFGFGSASSLVTAAASGAILGNMIGKAQSVGSNVKSGVKFASNSKTGQLMKQKYNDRKAERKDLKGLTHSEKKEYKQAKKSENTETMERLKETAKTNREQKAAEKAAKPINQMKANIRNKMDDNKVIKKAKTLGSEAKDKVKDFANSELGQALGADAKKFVRKVARPEKMAKVGAAVMAGAAMYALPDSNFMSAAMGGYAAGKAAENGVRNLKQRKKENFEEKAIQAYEKHCQINNIPPESRTKENFENWYNNTYLKGENRDAYSEKNMSKQQNDAREKLEAKGLSDGDIEEIIDKIQSAILKNQNYNPAEMFKGYFDDHNNEVSPEDIARIVQAYATKFNESGAYNDASAYNQQMQPLGVSHEDAISGIDAKEVRGKNESVEDYVEYITESDGTDKSSFDKARENAGSDASAKEIFKSLEAVVNQKMQEINQQVNALSSQLSNSSLGKDMAADVISKLEATVNSAINSSTSNLEGEINKAVSSLNLGANEGAARDYASKYVEQVKVTKEKRFVELVEERKVVNKQINKMINNP